VALSQPVAGPLATLIQAGLPARSRSPLCTLRGPISIGRDIPPDLRLEDHFQAHPRPDQYVDNWSLSFDVQILLRTVVICLVGRNAY
jgi:hypothetical protein